MIRATTKSIRGDIRDISSDIEVKLLAEAQTRDKVERHHVALSRQNEESEEVQEAIAEAQRLRVMVKTLGGSGKFGGFNAYAQRFTLEMIIDHANHYLKRLMSRYQLEMINDDKKPLNFQVIDRTSAMRSGA